MGAFFIIAVLCITSANHVLGLSEEMLELANMLHQNCQGQTGVAEDLILNARKGDFANDQPLKCYMMCLFMEMAVMEDDGTIDEDGVIGILPDENKEEGTVIIKKCGTKVGADNCETAWLTNKCYQENAPDKYFLP